MVELTFLGTSSGAPTKDRNVSGVAVSDGGAWDLFDCGEATQHRLLHTPLSLAKLRRVFISHLHGDHWFGLFGLLGSRSMAQAMSPLTVIGPVGLQVMVEAVLAGSSTHLTYRLDFIEVADEGGVVVDDASSRITALPLTHRVTSFAWFIEEVDRPGRFDAARARHLGVPVGPMFASLQRGDDVELEDGAVVASVDVMGPSRAGRRIVVSGDNSAPGRLLERTGPLHLLVHEATFTEPVVEAMGGDHGHSTARRVAIAAARCGVDALILTHFSARYGPSGTIGGLDDVEAEARTHFDGVLHLAADLDVFDVSADGEVERRP